MSANIEQSIVDLKRRIEVLQLIFESLRDTRIINIETRIRDLELRVDKHDEVILAQLEIYDDLISAVDALSRILTKLKTEIIRLEGSR